MKKEEKDFTIFDWWKKVMFDNYANFNGRVRRKEYWSFQLVNMMILFVPLWGFGGFVSAPEAPFMVLWLLAAYVFWQGVREDSQRWSVKKTWLILGLIMGLGFNTKFPIVLLAPGFGLYLLMSPKHHSSMMSFWTVSSLP